MNPLFVRVDASLENGTGHLMRCIALAQAWRGQHGDALFLSHCDKSSLRKRIVDEGFELMVVEKPHPNPEDLRQTQRLLEEG